MKKLSLKNLNLGANDLLQRNQLKTVFGGDGGYYGCQSGCVGDNDCSGGMMGQTFSCKETWCAQVKVKLCVRD